MGKLFGIGYSWGGFSLAIARTKKQEKMSIYKVETTLDLKMTSIL